MSIIYPCMVVLICIFMYVCMCMFWYNLYVGVYIYIYVCVCVCLYVYTYTRVYNCSPHYVFIYFLMLFGFFICFLICVLYEFWIYEFATKIFNVLHLFLLIVSVLRCFRFHTCIWLLHVYLHVLWYNTCTFVHVHCA